MSFRGSLVVVSHACNRAVNRAPYIELARLGWKVLVVTAEALPDDGRMLSADPSESSEISVVTLPLQGSHARLQRYEGLPSVLMHERPDWVVADIDPHSALAIELVFIKARLQYRLGFISCENLPFTPLKLARRRGWRGILLGIACSAARLIVRPHTDVVFCINSMGERMFRAAGFRRVEKTPLGFPEQIFNINLEIRSLMRAQLNLISPTIAYFGRLTPEKGVHVLLDALDRLTEKDWHLIIDDFQPDTDYQRQIRLRVESARWADRARLVEAKHGEVAKYMNAADVTVVPSISTSNWTEQYGRVLPEAMACGSRVIASNSGALPELLQGYGQMFEEGDVDGLACELSNALDDVLKDSRRSFKSAEYSRRRLSAAAQASLWNQVLSRDTLVVERVGER